MGRKWAHVGAGPLVGAGGRGKLARENGRESQAAGTSDPRIGHIQNAPRLRGMQIGNPMQSNFAEAANGQ